MTNIEIHNIEDCLEVITGLQHHDLHFKIDNSDSTIMNSVARQVFRGTALTDRQYNLMKEKLLSYKEQFEQNNIDYIETVVEKLRKPLRTIDRSKYITIVDTKDVYKDSPYESHKEKLKWIKIRFPFSKKDIVKIESAAHKAKKTYYHPKGSHEHYFVLNEVNVYNVLSEFENKEYKIDDELLEIYKECCEIKDQSKKYFAHYENNKFMNLNNFQKEYINSHNLNELQIIDRSILLGYEVEYEKDSKDSVLDLVLSRTETDVCIKPSLYTITDIIKTVLDLDRFPLLVVLDETKAQDQILEVYRNFNSVVSPEEQCVLFRQEGQTEFNTFVKEKKLNNWLDKNTKIVYISNTTLPKLLIKESFKPIASLVFDNTFNNFVNTFIKCNCDLVFHYAEVLSPYRRYSKYYGYM